MRVITSPSAKQLIFASIKLRIKETKAVVFNLFTCFAF